MRAATALLEERHKMNVADTQSAQNDKISNTHTILKVYIENVTGRRWGWRRREGEAGAKN